jgi:hypothetical protein
LGIGRPYVSVVSSLVLALTSFFYVYTISSYFRINVYILDNRVTYIDSFDKYVFNKFIDNIIVEVGVIAWFLLSFRGKLGIYVASLYGGTALVSLCVRLNIINDIVTLISVPLAVFFLTYNKFTFKKVLDVSSDLTVNYIAIIGTVAGMMSIVISMSTLFSSLSTPLPVPNYVYDISSLLSNFSPILMVLLIFCFPVKILINALTEKILHAKHSNSNSSITTVGFTNAIIPGKKILYLILFMLLSTILVLIPHQPTINTDNQRIGFDTKYYANWLGNLTNADNAQEFLHQAFVVQSGGDRPLALIFFYTIVKIAKDNSFYAVEYIPIILGPALVLIVYFLTRELTSNDITSLLAAFLTAVSFHTLVGIYAGFYANWLALVEGYLCCVFLIRFLRESKRLNYILYSASMIILLLTHVYTWSILVIVFAVFLVVMLMARYYSRRNISLLLLVIVLATVVDISRTTLTGSAGGIIRDLEIADKSAGIELFSRRWTTLTETIHIYVGGQFSNFIILGLSLYWLFLFNLRKASNIFIVIFLSTGFLPLFIGDWAIQTRIFYNIPFQIPAAIALTHLRRQPNTRILVVPICIWLIAISIIAVSNFHLILPS